MKIDPGDTLIRTRPPTSRYRPATFVFADDTVTPVFADDTVTPLPLAIVGAGLLVAAAIIHLHQGGLLGWERRFG